MFKELQTISVADFGPKGLRSTVKMAFVVSYIVYCYRVVAKMWAVAVADRLDVDVSVQIFGRITLLSFEATQQLTKVQTIHAFAVAAAFGLLSFFVLVFIHVFLGRDGLVQGRRSGPRKALIPNGYGIGSEPKKRRSPGPRQTKKSPLGVFHLESER